MLLITNSDAGSNDRENVEKVVATLRTSADIEVCETGNLGELDGVLHRRGGRRLVVAGGDGSLHAVIAALHRRNELAGTVVGLVPLGTGNDFARGAGIPLDPVAAANLVLEGRVRPVDLLVDCAGEVVVNSVHLGVGAHASRNAEALKPTLGRLGYVVGAAIAAVNPPFVRLRVEADGEVVVDFDRPVLQVALANGSHVGGGTELAPDADPGDGQMDLMVSFAVGPLARLGYAALLRVGRHHERDDVLYRRARQVTVAGEGFTCSADGEVFGPERNRTWHVEPGAFAMPLPG